MSPRDAKRLTAMARRVKAMDRLRTPSAKLYLARLRELTGIAQEAFEIRVAAPRISASNDMPADARRPVTT